MPLNTLVNNSNHEDATDKMESSAKKTVNNLIKSSVSKSIVSNDYQNDTKAIIDSVDSSIVADNQIIVESRNTTTNDDDQISVNDKNATKTDDNDANNETMINIDWTNILVLFATLLLSLILII